MATDRDGGIPVYKSSGSGGLWNNFLLSGEDVKAWATATLQQFEKESAQLVVRRREGFVFNDSEETELTYADLIYITIEKTSDEPRIQANYIMNLHLNSIVVQMEKYLPYLQTKLEQLNMSILTTSSLNSDLEENTYGTWKRNDSSHKKKYGNGTILINWEGIEIENSAIFVAPKKGKEVIYGAQYRDSVNPCGK